MSTGKQRIGTMDVSQSSGRWRAVLHRLRRLSLLAGLAMLASPLSAQEGGPPDRGPPLRPAVPPPPIVDARFPVEVAPGVFVIPDKRIPLVPNIGIIVGRDKVLVVDSGMGVESARSVLAAARRLAPGRKIVFTITHAHPEHAFSAQVFKGRAELFYNRTQRDYLASAGERLLAGFRGILPPEQRGQLDGITITPPDRVYEGDHATLDLGGRVVEFRTWGTAHTPGDQIIYLPREKIVFAGDLIEERAFPIVPLFPPMIALGDIDVAHWQKALADIKRLKPWLVVPGHGNLGGVELVDAVADYFADVRAMVKAAGGSRAGLVENIRAKHPTWESADFIGPAVEYFVERP